MKRFRKMISKLVMMAMMIGNLIVPAFDVAAAEDSVISLSGTAHVQTYGDKDATIVNEDGIETLVLGSRGESKRVEQITINFENNTGYEGSMEYRVHRQTYGWTAWVEAGQPAGTTGESKRLEAIEIRLTGELAEHYDVRYAAHAQNYGDSQGWVYNGALAGTTGESKRLEEIKVQIIPKGMISQEQVSYRVHRQTYGWEPSWAYDGKVSGTTGQSKRLEGITIDIKGNTYDGGITYRTHVQTYGWLDWVSDGEMSGTQGESKRLEAIEIKLTGEMAEHYDVYYRVHAQTFGWMGWVSNGAPAGTSGYGYRLEAIQIVLVEKTEAAPSPSLGGVTQSTSEGYSEESAAQEETQIPKQPTEEDSVAVPVNHLKRVGTYEVIKCGDCRTVFHNMEDLELHYGEEQYDQCEGNTEPIIETKEYTIQNAYTEYPEAGKTTVPAVYEIQWVVDEESFVEEDVEIIEKVYYDKCLQCGKKYYSQDYYIKKFGYYDKYDPEMSLGVHLRDTDCYSYGGDYSEYIQTGIKDVVHPELGHWERVKVEEEYTK